MDVVNNYNRLDMILNNENIKNVRTLIDRNNFNHTQNNVEQFIFLYEYILNVKKYKNETTDIKEKIFQDDKEEDKNSINIYHLIFFINYYISTNQYQTKLGSDKLKPIFVENKFSTVIPREYGSKGNKQTEIIKFSDYLQKLIEFSKPYNIIKEGIMYKNIRESQKIYLNKIINGEYDNIISNNIFTLTKFSNGGLDFGRYTDNGMPYCYLCGKILIYNYNARKIEDISIDHVIPVIPAFVIGGLQCPLNFAPVHFDCNLKKSDRLFLSASPINKAKRSRYNGGIPGVMTKSTVLPGTAVFNRRTSRSTALVPLNKQSDYKTRPDILKLQDKRSSRSLQQKQKPIIQKPTLSFIAEDEEDNNEINKIISFLKKHLAKLNTNSDNINSQYKYILYTELLTFYEIINILNNRKIKGGGSINTEEQLYDRIDHFLDDFDDTKNFVTMFTQFTYVDPMSKSERIKYILSRLIIIYKYSEVFHETSKNNSGLPQYYQKSYSNFIETRIRESIDISTKVNKLELR
jgi:hypothetical protein